MILSFSIGIIKDKGGASSPIPLSRIGLASVSADGTDYLISLSFEFGEMAIGTFLAFHQNLYARLSWLFLNRSPFLYQFYCIRFG
jgi:hypothetical protein